MKLHVLYKSAEQERHIETEHKLWAFDSNFMLSMSEDGQNRLKMVINFIMSL